MILVYRYRVKSLNGLLNRQSRACNFVWNYCNDRQKDALRFGRPWLSGFDLNKLTTGSSKEPGLHSGTVNAVCEQSQVCSNCGAMPDSRPKGIADLGTREWQCRVCGCMHDRDINAAINILRRGRATLAAGIPVL
jgi:hypothetical protein